MSTKTKDNPKADPVKEPLVAATEKEVVSQEVAPKGTGKPPKKDMTTMVSTSLSTDNVGTKAKTVIVQVKYPKDYTQTKHMTEGRDYEISQEGYETLKAKGILK